VVDDHQTGLYVKSRILATAGFQVFEATSGLEALALIAEQRPVLVVLDVQLPDMDGKDVCRAIKQNPETAGTMVLQVSAYYTSAEDQVQGLDSGADAYIPGDIAPALLVAAVRALLRTRRAEDAVRDREERVQLVEALDRSQQELRALAASLFTAQEEERRRIARELHDDFSQRMALLEMELTQLRRGSPELDEQLSSVIAQISALSQELRNVSHDLHPSGLEHLGLEAGLRSLCEEFERAHKLPIRFSYSEEGRRVSPPVATVLYRIAQEALRNVVKHAGDARVTMEVWVEADQLCLAISDDGCGFKMGAHSNQAGLGLISMQERARLVDGRVEVQSTPAKGTKVKVCVPASAD
jgi:two-component system CheB/CheR fusion protein